MPLHQSGRSTAFSSVSLVAVHTFETMSTKRGRIAFETADRYVAAVSDISGTGIGSIPCLAESCLYRITGRRSRLLLPRFVDASQMVAGSLF